MITNLSKRLLKNGGEIQPLLIPYELSKGTGQMNPSLFIDNGKLLINVRGVQYILNHSENKQYFNSPYGPLSYLNPEHDRSLRTTNFYMEMTPELEVLRVDQVDTSKLDVKPLWEFIGLEDARLVRWDGKLYLIGVRRDTTDNGVGRMELSEIVVTNNSVAEVSRVRIEPPNKDSYCEKNWMPVIDMPFTMVKWTKPTEVVSINVAEKQAEQLFVKSQNVYLQRDQRGGSSVIPFKDYRIAIIHEVNLYKNTLQQKDADYFHRFIVWDKDWNIVMFSDNFNFMDSKVEFCCGLGILGDNVYITFGNQDNAAYILKTSINQLIDIIWNS